MAAEYKLKFTAQEIDSKLGKISEIENSLENKQDKLTFDAEPAEGSENPITSGGVYNALQNVGDGTDLVAGDFIEIKDGVVRCTFGDVIGATEIYNEIFSAESLSWQSYANGIVMSAHYADSLPEKGDIIKVAFKLPGDTEPFYYTTEVIDRIPALGMTVGCAALCNVSVDSNGTPTILDSTIPAFLMHLYKNNSGDRCVWLFAFTSYTDASISISVQSFEPQYVLLPDTALGLGREIVTEVNEEIVNVESIEMEEDGVFMAIITPQKLPENGTILNVSFTPSGKLEPINFTAEVTELIIDGEFISWIASCNATFSLDDGSITAIDESLPGFVIQMLYDDGELDAPMIVIASATDYTGASIVINNKATIITHVKLPMEALPFNFDIEPTEGSENLVNSGAVYDALQNVKPELDFDSVPTENSENLLTSGNIYNSLRDFEKNLPKPQLTEGIIYYQEDSKGFSTNKKAPPTGDNAWIEGTAGYVDLGWSPILDQSAMKITLNCNEEGNNYAEEISNNIKSCDYLYVIFEQEPEKKYFIRIYETWVHINGYYVYFYYDFINGFDSFPTDPSYKIKKLIGLFRCGSSSHAEGIKTGATGTASHAEGYQTIARREYSHAEGCYTIANGVSSHVQGRYNIEDKPGKYAHIVGNGTSDSARSNAHTLDWDGNAWFAGDIYVGDNKRVLTEGEIANITIDSIITDMINISAPGNNIISEIVTITFSNASTGRVLGQNILVPGQWYLVTYDGFEYILTPDTNGYSYYMGDDSKYGFEITQTINDSIKATNITTPDNNEHTITISRLETLRVNLMDYIFRLENRVRQLEERLIEN